MNKTVTINISGIIFHIEEDAYDHLSKYLTTIKGYFSKTDGGNEIMSDIEARIAELLQAKISPSKQVILMSDVEHVINVMGKPEEFAGEQPVNENKDEKENRWDESRERIKRRLFRNPDEKAIGGVCSGLAAYFGIDTVWVRLAMFLLIFFGGLSLWVYIILWIVIPEAKTTADRLAMRGESANINSIFKSFQEEAEDMKSRMNKYGKEFGSRRYSETASSNLAVALNGIFNIIGRLIGLFLIFIGGSMLFAYVTSLFGISILDANNHLTHWRKALFESPADYALALFAFITVVGIPIISLIYAGVKLLFKIRYNNRWLNLSLGILWTIGLCTGFYMTATTIKQFNENARIKESYTLRGVGDTLIVKMNPLITNLKDTKFDNSDDIETHFSRHQNNYFFGENGSRLSVIGLAGLNVTASNSDSIEMTITRSARGKTKRNAGENAEMIEYIYNQNGNVLVFDEIFIAAEGSKFRSQDVDIKIKLPKGKVVYFDKSTKYLLDDIENTSNTWDGKMISRRWKMTEKGLECIDCEGLDIKKDKHNNKHRKRSIKTEKVIINRDGIEVSDSETEIKINDEGIKIRTSDDEDE